MFLSHSCCFGYPGKCTKKYCPGRGGSEDEREPRTDSDGTTGDVGIV